MPNSYPEGIIYQINRNQLKIDEVADKMNDMQESIQESIEGISISPIRLVQRGLVTINDDSGGYDATVTISIVNPSNAFLLVNGCGTGVDASAVKAILGINTITFQGVGSKPNQGSITMAWQVIEYV